MSMRKTNRKSEEANSTMLSLRALCVTHVYTVCLRCSDVLKCSTKLIGRLCLFGILSFFLLHVSSRLFAASFQLKTMNGLALFTLSRYYSGISTCINSRTAHKHFTDRLSQKFGFSGFFFQINEKKNVILRETLWAASAFSPFFSVRRPLTMVSNFLLDSIRFILYLAHAAVCELLYF